MLCKARVRHISFNYYHSFSILLCQTPCCIAYHCHWSWITYFWFKPKSAVFATIMDEGKTIPCFAPQQPSNVSLDSFSFFRFHFSSLWVCRLQSATFVVYLFGFRVCCCVIASQCFKVFTEFRFGWIFSRKEMYRGRKYIKNYNFNDDYLSRDNSQKYIENINNVKYGQKRTGENDIEAAAENDGILFVFRFHL